MDMVACPSYFKLHKSIVSYNGYVNNNFMYSYEHGIVKTIYNIELIT